MQVFLGVATFIEDVDQLDNDFSLLLFELDLLWKLLGIGLKISRLMAESELNFVELRPLHWVNFIELLKYSIGSLLVLVC